MQNTSFLADSDNETSDQERNPDETSDDDDDVDHTDSENTWADDDATVVQKRKFACASKDEADVDVYKKCCRSVKEYTVTANKSELLFALKAALQDFDGKGDWRLEWDHFDESKDTDTITVYHKLLDKLNLYVIATPGRDGHDLVVEVWEKNVNFDLQIGKHIPSDEKLGTFDLNYYLDKFLFCIAEGTMKIGQACRTYFSLLDRSMLDFIMLGVDQCNRCVALVQFDNQRLKLSLDLAKVRSKHLHPKNKPNNQLILDNIRLRAQVVLLRRPSRPLSACTN